MLTPSVDRVESSADKGRRVVVSIPREGAADCSQIGTMLKRDADDDRRIARQGFEVATAFMAINEKLADATIAVAANRGSEAEIAVIKLERFAAAAIGEALAACHRAPSRWGKARPAMAVAIVSDKPNRRAIFLA
jgi:hypothetical protein